MVLTCGLQAGTKVFFHLVCRETVVSYQEYIKNTIHVNEIREDVRVVKT